MEQLRRESIDLRVNPVGMRRVLFKLQTSFSRARKKQLKQQQLEEARAKQSGDASEAPPAKLSNECAVCLVNFAPDDLVVPLGCNVDHLFHMECLLSWANHNYTCPICRQPVIASRDEINLYEMMH